MHPFTERFREVVARYLDGRQSLERAATDLVPVLREWKRALADAGRPTTLEELLGDRIDIGLLDAAQDLFRGLTKEQFSRPLDLFMLASRKLADPQEGAA